MLAVERATTCSSTRVPAARYLVRRSGGAEPLWGARARAHGKGAPVTLAQVTGIYVHTKAIIVDDVFVGIGSCNTNRRGFFHDGEITAFAVPGAAQGVAARTPRCALRTALWAEHLGIPPAMGRRCSPTRSPRSSCSVARPQIGNRMSTFDALGIEPELGFPARARRG